MSITHLCNKKGKIEGIAASADAVGGTVQTVTLIADNVPCRIRQLSAKEIDGLGREMAESTHRIYCDARDDVTTTCQWTIDEIVYQVTGVNNPHGLDRHLEVNARLLQ